MQLISHQQVGLNRCGAYWRTCRTKGPESAPTGRRDSGASGASGGGTAARQNEPWRRWTGMVGGDAERLTLKQRRRGVRRLIKQIERKMAESLVNQLAAMAAPPECGVRGRWGGDIDGWRRTQTAGRSLESICVEFGISKPRLNALTQEYCALQAQEVIDGYKLRGLKQVLLAQLREAARALWDRPGQFAYKLCMREPELPPSLEREENDGGSAGRFRMPPRRSSRCFRTRPSEFFGLEEGDDEHIRLAELLGKLDELREANGWSAAGMAMSLGFTSAASLRRACLNVMGRTPAQLERILARELVAYYLAAESRTIREIAFRDDEYGFRAREIYGITAETVPTEPYCDRWTLNEAASKAWLEAMEKEFG